MKTQSMSGMLIVSATILLSLISCKKEDLPKERTNQDWWTCHDASDRDEQATRQHLIGTWNWEHKACPFNPNDVPTSTEHSGLSAEFKSDNTLIIRQDGDILLTTNWDLAVSELYTSTSPSLTFKLQSDSLVSQLFGVIVFCENEALFMSSYVDGCDNRFEKEN